MAVVVSATFGETSEQVAHAVGCDREFSVVGIEESGRSIGGGRCDQVCVAFGEAQAEQIDRWVFGNFIHDPGDVRGPAKFISSPSRGWLQACFPQHYILWLKILGRIILQLIPEFFIPLLPHRC